MIQCANHTELDIVTKWTITMTYFELCLVIMNHLQFCFGEIFAFAV